MDAKQRAFAIETLRALAVYVQRGGYIEIHEPRVRGRKGPDRQYWRYITIKVERPAAFDALRWRMGDHQATERLARQLERQPETDWDAFTLEVAQELLTLLQNLVLANGGEWTDEERPEGPLHPQPR